MPAESHLETLDPKLGRIVKEYLEAVERGENPSAEEWISRHAEFAQPLRDFFASRQQLGELLREAKHGAASEQTMDSAAGGVAAARGTENSALRLRYFGDYELESEIARGGMGVVFRARQVSLNRPVAVKMILSGELASSDDVARFRTEAEAAANLDHPAIVPIYEIGEREGQHYFSMKFIDGESLSQRLQKTAGKSLTREELQERVELVIAVARGIHYAHQRGIIHRDLKPANILIDSAGQPHITDFGLARKTAADSQLTRTGAIVGTPSYMAPEQALGSKGATTAVDIYGLGAILYAALTGRPPFEGQNPLETILHVQKEPPVPPSRLNPAVDHELEVICLKCLEKDPEARYRSAGELADDLARWVRGEPIQAMPPNAARLFWRWFSTNFKTAACVLAIGIVTGLLVSESVINMLAHNLGSYAVIYRGSFPAEEAPWILEAMEAYPRWISIFFLPFMLLGVFGMGWFTDRLVKPQDLAGALLSGLGVGTAAAFTAFMFGIGWQTLIQVAAWPSQPDLELLVSEISKDTTFSDGHTIATKYPADINGQPVYTRYVMKKALADMQARIPLGLWYGFGFSACVLLLPATLQTVAAQYLRSRGDRWWWQILHLAELSIPTSLMLMALGMLLWNTPTLAVQLLLLPLIGLATLHPLRQTHILARRAILATIIILFVLLLYSGRAVFFSNSGGINFAHTAVGTIAAVLAVICRFRWWQRLLLYGIWVAILIFADGVPFGARSALDPGVPLDRQILISALGSGLLLGMTGLFARLSKQETPFGAGH